MMLFSVLEGELVVFFFFVSLRLSLRQDPMLNTCSTQSLCNPKLIIIIFHTFNLSFGNNNFGTLLAEYQGRGLAHALDTTGNDGHLLHKDGEMVASGKPIVE